MPTPFRSGGRQHRWRRYREPPADPARSENLCMYEISMRENREIPRSPAGWLRGGPRGEGRGRKPAMHDRGKSDRPVVPAKPPNNAAAAAAEAVEGRGLAKGNAASETRPGRRAGVSVPSALDRVRQVAAQGQGCAVHRAPAPRRPSTAWRRRIGRFARSAAPGVDGVTWQDYGQELEENLRDLHARVHRGAYRAKPSRRVYIPKADGRQRPLGIAALEDKIVQRAVVEVLNAIYEEDFLGFSYGFRPGRSPHRCAGRARGRDHSAGR